MIDSDHASVDYTLLFAGQPQFGVRTGTAVRIDGVWKVSRDTECALLALGAVACPAADELMSSAAVEAGDDLGVVGVREEVDHHRLDRVVAPAVSSATSRPAAAGIAADEHDPRARRSRRAPRHPRDRARA